MVMSGMSSMNDASVNWVGRLNAACKEQDDGRRKKHADGVCRAKEIEDEARRSSLTQDAERKALGIF